MSVSRLLPLGLLSAAALLLGLAAAVPATASPDPASGLPDRSDVMKIAIVRDTTPGCTPSCAEWVAAQGKIVPETRAAFTKVLASLGDRKLPILIDSIGGSVPDAIAIGRVIRARQLDVVVTRTALDGCDAAGDGCAAPFADGARPGQPRGIGAVCASSCTLILAAGVKREAAPWTLVGVHQIVVKQTMTRVERLYTIVSRRINGEKVVLNRTLVGTRPLSTFSVTRKPPPEAYQTVAAYLSDMGIGPGLMPLMLSTPSTSIHWVTAAEGDGTGLVNARVDGEYLAAEAARAGNAAVRGSDPVPAPEEALFIKADPASGAPTSSVGRVTWTLERPGAGNAPVLRADVEVPASGLHLVLRMGHPVTGSAPVLDLAFTVLPSGFVRAVDSVGVPQVGKLDDAGQLALAGTVMPQGANAFRVRLADDAGRPDGTEAVVETQPWLGIPMTVDGGARAVLMVRHDASGTPLIARAFAAWKSGASQASILPVGAFLPRS